MRFGVLLSATIAVSVVAHGEEPRAVEPAQGAGPAPTTRMVPTPPDSFVPEALQKQLDAVLATKDYAELAKALNKAPPTERLAWLTSRLYAGKTVFLGYALVRDLWGLAQLKDARIKETADTAAGIMALYVYSVVLIDGAICEDVSARGPQHIQFLATFRPLFQSLKTLSVEEKKTIISGALRIEQQTRILRKGDDFLCRGGMDEFKASVEQLGPNVTIGELAAKHGEKSKSGFGTDVRLPAAKGYTPRFLSFEKYAPEQHKLRLEMVGLLIDVLK